MKKHLILHLKDRGITAIDLGVAVGEKGDYPNYAELVSEKIVNQEADLGLLICGTGVGMSISANKVSGIRAVVCSDPYSAKMARSHNDSNVLCMGERVVGPELAVMILDHWLDASFEGGRHQTRVDLIHEIEKKHR